MAASLEEHSLLLESRGTQTCILWHLAKVGSFRTTTPTQSETFAELVANPFFKTILPLTLFSRTCFELHLLCTAICYLLLFFIVKSYISCLFLDTLCNVVHGHFSDKFYGHKHKIVSGCGGSQAEHFYGEGTA